MNFCKITMSSTLSFNASLLGLNTNAKEFKPQNTSNSLIDTLIDTSKNTSKIHDENFFFDKLEKDFVKNNEWLFFV